VKSQISVKTRQHPSAHSTSDKPFPALHVEEVGMIPNVHAYPMNTIGFSEHTINSPPRSDRGCPPSPQLFALFG